MYKDIKEKERRENILQIRENISINTRVHSQTDRDRVKRNLRFDFPQTRRQFFGCTRTTSSFREARELAAVQPIGGALYSST